MGLTNMYIPTQEEFKSLSKLRLKIFSEIKKCIEEGMSTKDYEGRLSIRFPDYFDDFYNEDFSVTIHLSLYVFGPSRGYDWRGKTLAEAVSDAEKDIDEWIEIENDRRKREE